MADPEVQRRAVDNLASAIRSAQRQVDGAIREAQGAALAAARLSEKPPGLDAAAQFFNVLADLRKAQEALDAALKSAPAPLEAGRD